MKLSVIIPFFNAEPFLEKCILSVMNGAHSGECEIVLVNDGSTDGGPAIAERYASKHSMVKLVSQENKGLSGARNTGIVNSSGDYIWYVDADDWIEPDSVGYLLKVIDSGPFDYISLSAKNSDGGRIRNVIPESDKPLQVFQSLKWQDCATMYVWNRDFILSHGLFFTEGLFFEDSELTPKALYQAGTCFVSNKMLYNVLVHEGSITRSRSLKKNYDHLEVGKSLLEFRDSRVDDEKSRQVFNQRICVMVNRALLGMTKCSRGEIRRFNSDLAGEKALTRVFKESSILRYRFEYLLFSLLGKDYVAAFRFLNLFKGLKA